MADGLVIPGPEEEFERKGDFEKPTFSLSGVSTDIRPDALSFDHLTAFSLGPIAIGDTSKGVVFKPWRIRYNKPTGEFFIKPDDGDEVLLFSLNVLPSYRDTVAADSPTRWYPLDDNGVDNIVTDISGNEAHGTYEGSDFVVNQPGIVSSDPNPCVRFTNNSGGSYISIPNIDLSNKSFTVEGWFLPDSLGLVTLFSNYQSASNQRNIGCWQYANGSVSLQFWGNDLISSAGAVEAQKLYHYVGRYDASSDTSSVWINGVKVAESNVGPMLAAATITRFLAYALGIGTFGSVPFVGKVQHLAIYSGVALPDARIIAHYNSGLTPLIDPNSVKEIDLAFTQNGDPTVCVQIDNDIWLYWFDPQINDFTFVKLGPGRNPRIVLDNPDIVPDSDVLLFYMSEDQDALVYRIQRERYENEHVTPVTGVINKFTEEAYKSSGNRLHVLYSERNPTTGRYSLRQLNSKLFPFILPPEGINVGVSVVSIQNVVAVLLIQYELEVEGLEVSVDVVQVDLINILIEPNILPEGLDISVDVVSTESPVVLIQPDILEEGLDISVDVQSVESPVIMIQPNINPEGVDCSVEVQSVTLDTP